jgi:hypothetical protein
MRFWKSLMSEEPFFDFLSYYRRFFCQDIFCSSACLLFFGIRNGCQKPNHGASLPGRETAYFNGFM